MSDRPVSDEKQLIAACLRGDQSAYALLVERYQDRLFAALVRFLGNPEDALDVAQEAFVSAFLALDRFQGGARFYTWLYRIAMNHAIDLRRRAHVKRNVRRVEEQVPNLPDQRAASPGSRMEQQEAVELMQQALLLLSAEHRLVLVLKDLEGMRYEEIAKIAGVPVGTVRSRLHRARLELRAILEPSESEELDTSETG